MLTREQIHQMLDMRLDGATYDAIGQHFGVSKQRVQQILCGKERKGSGERNATSKQNRLERYVFPNIAVWMKENDCTLTMLAEKTHIDVRTLSKQMRGLCDPGLKTVRKIVETTGLPFEAAFERRCSDG